MDCQFCNVCEATNLQYPTMLGAVFDLCDDCAKKYGPQGRLAGKVSPASDLNKGGGPVTTTPILNPIEEGFESHDTRQFTT